MSKYNYSMMSNDEISVVCFNKKKWTRKEAIEQGKKELSGVYDMEDVELEAITSVVQFGFWKAPDGEVYNNWFCPNIYEPSIVETKTQVPVWLVRIKEKEIKKTFTPGQIVWYKPKDHNGIVYKSEAGIVKRMSSDETAAFVWYHSGCTAARTPIEYLEPAAWKTTAHKRIHTGCKECEGNPEAIMDILLGQ